MRILLIQQLLSISRAFIYTSYTISSTQQTIRDHQLDNLTFYSSLSNFALDLFKIFITDLHQQIDFQQYCLQQGFNSLNTTFLFIVSKYKCDSFVIGLQHLNSHTKLKMQYSQIASTAAVSKFAPDSSFFIHYDASRLYIKESSVEMKNIAIINTSSPISEAEISTNSKYIAIFMNKKNLIQVYKVEDSSLVAKIQDPSGGIISMFWVVNSLELMVFSEFMYKVSIYNLTDKSMAYIKSPKLSTQKGFCFSLDGKFMALLQKHDCKDYLSVYYTRDWKMVNTFALDLFDTVEIKWSPNNAYLTAWDNCINYRILVFSHMCGQVLKYEPYNFALGIKTVRFSNNSLFLAIGSFDQKIRLINGLTWQEIGQLDCSNPLINAEKISVHKEEEINKNTNRMKNVEQKNYRIPTSKTQTIASSDKAVPIQGVGALQFSEDDQYIACRNDNMPYTVWVWSVSTLEPVAIISCSTHVKSVKWTSKENYLCIVNGTDRVLFWRPNGTIAECIFSFQHKKISIQKMKWSNDGGKALISDKNEVVYAEMIPEALDKPSFY